MTYEEALHQISAAVRKRTTIFSMRISKDCHSRIVSALKKQIPKKLRVDDEGWLCCPNCDETFKLHDQFRKRNKYCGECGQAIDWSDTE